MNTARFAKAFAYALQVHGAIERKGTTIPYVSHLMAVSALVMEYGGDEDQAIAALLHDAIEDGGPGHIEPIRSEFGERVLSIVRACSDSESEPEDKADSWQRKERYLAHLKDAPVDVLLVSCADKLHNSTTILEDHRRFGEQLWQRFNTKKDEQLRYYTALAAVFAERLPGPISSRLRATVDTLLSEVPR